MSTAHVNKEYLDGLRERFDAGHAPITMGELDALITFAHESERRASELEAWFHSMPKPEGWS